MTRENGSHRSVYDEEDVKYEQEGRDGLFEDKEKGLRRPHNRGKT